MKQQIIRKAFVLVILAGSAYVTLNLSWTYAAAVTGHFEGAGAAQWQFAFMLAPVPSALGLLSLAIAYLTQPSLSNPYIVGSLVATIAPLVLLGLVLMHAY